MLKTAITLVSLAALLYVLAALTMYLLQRKLIYYPTPVAAHPYKERQIEVDNDVNLRIIEVNSDKKDAVIYFGGNAEWVAGTAAELAAAVPDKTLYLVNYRGYSGSDGTPTETHLFNDAVTTFDTLATDHDSISVIGRSLGSGVACYLASRKAVARLVLITPFDSILKVAQSAYPVFPVRWLLRDQFESTKYAPSVRANVLALLAEHDQIIPMQSSQRLLPHFSAHVTSLILKGTGHNDIQIHSDFYSAIGEFLSTTP